MNGVDRGLNIFESTMSKITTIRVREEAKRLLIKTHPRETYEEVILRLIEK